MMDAASQLEDDYSSTGESYMASIGQVGDMVGLDKILGIFGGCWMDCGVCEKEKE